MLLEAIECALEPTNSGSEKLNAVIDSIRDAHLGIVRELRSEDDDQERSEISDELENEIRGDCEGVRGFLIAAQVC